MDAKIILLRWRQWTAAGSFLLSAVAITLVIVSPSFGYNTAPAAGSFNVGEFPTAGHEGQPQSGNKLLTAARAVLADRLAVNAASLTLVDQESVRWPDSSLGCPKPGYKYAKAIIPGYRFTFSYEGKQYEVHTAGETGPASGMPPVSCEGGIAY